MTAGPSRPGHGSNRQWRLARAVAAGERIGRAHFEFTSAPVPVLDAPGQILVRTHVLSTSPAQRSYVSLARSMHAKVAVGAVMRGRGIGVVAESRHPDFPVGTVVNGSLGWQDYVRLAPGPGGGILLLEAVADPVQPLGRHLGVLGSAGATAYFGLLEVGRLRAGDTVVISAAAGGVGSIAGQIARLRGARVIGIAGGAEKCAWIRDELGFHAAIDYRGESVERRLGELCPEGINVYFDNVGGEILDAALEHLALGARVVVCGFIATDGDDRAPGPRHYKNLVRRRARMEGFFVFDYRERMREAEAWLRAWYDAGGLRPTEQEVHGLEHMPEVLESLFTGGNRGVALCRVAD